MWYFLGAGTQPLSRGSKPPCNPGWFKARVCCWPQASRPCPRPTRQLRLDFVLADVATQLDLKTAGVAVVAARPHRLP